MEDSGILGPLQLPPVSVTVNTIGSRVLSTPDPHSTDPSVDGTWGSMCENWTVDNCCVRGELGGLTRSNLFPSSIREPPVRTLVAPHDVCPMPAN